MFAPPLEQTGVVHGVVTACGDWRQASVAACSKSLKLSLCKSIKGWQGGRGGIPGLGRVGRGWDCRWAECLNQQFCKIQAAIPWQLQSGLNPIRSIGTALALPQDRGKASLSYGRIACLFQHRLGLHCPFLTYNQHCWWNHS